MNFSIHRVEEGADLFEISGENLLLTQRNYKRKKSARPSCRHFPYCGLINREKCRKTIQTTNKNSHWVQQHSFVRIRSIFR